MAKERTLLISELFHSCQGESSTLGCPAVFIRLVGCSMGCVWCDSRHAWRNGQRRTISSVIDEVATYSCDRVCVTGGEPLEHRNFDLLVKELKKNNYIIEVETNGTRVPPATGILLDVAKWNVSIKLAGNGVSVKKRIRSEAIKFFASLPNAEFKFVISNKEDFNEMERLRFDYHIDKSKVSLMAEGNQRRTLIKNMKKLVELAKKSNYRVTPRLHTFLWGSKRGV